MKRCTCWRSAVGILLAFALLACETEPVETERQQRVRTAAVAAGALEQRSYYPGRVLAVERAALAFQSSGILDSRPARVGDQVQAGDLLATLRNPDLEPGAQAAQARLVEAIARRDQVQRDLRRFEELVTEGAVSRQQLERQRAELDTAEAGVQRARAELTASRSQLGDAALVAPFDGLVVGVLREPGEFLAAGEPVLTLSGAALEVEIRVPPELLSDLKPGQDMSVHLDQRRRQLTGQIVELGQAGDPQTGLATLVIGLPADAGARAGQAAEVTLIQHTPEAFIVPLAAVSDPVGGNPRVFRIAGQQVQQIAVTVLGGAGDRLVVEGPLAVGDQVVVAGHRVLGDGDPVRVVP